MNRVVTALALAGFSSLFIERANADFTLDFMNITNNSGVNVASQLSVLVSDPGGGYADFTFYNDVGIGSSITDVYFDDGALLAIAQIFSTAGVEYMQPATPGNLPGGGGIDPPFMTTTGFSADSNSPIAANGVDAANEWVRIRYSLQNGQTFADVYDDILDGTLRIGLHVQSIDGAGANDSDGFVNLIPTPGAGFLGVVGLCLLGGLRRRLG